MTIDIQGTIAPGFDAVADAFEANFASGNEIGAAFALYRHGEKLIDIHAGHADRKRERGWQADTLIPVFSTGKAITALPAQKRRLGILFQDDLLFPHLSVGANLAFGLDSGVTGRRARRAKVEEALAQAGLAGFHDRDPATLSGGQRARAALMRTLLASPRALLLDEPFSKLDRPLRKDIREFVFGHARALGVPTLLVTHDHEDAEAAGGPVVTLAPAAQEAKRSS